jgi:hypothetical protein
MVSGQLCRSALFRRGLVNWLLQYSAEELNRTDCEVVYHKIGSAIVPAHQAVGHTAASLSPVVTLQHRGKQA